jgi:hypothetical protein
MIGTETMIKIGQHLGDPGGFASASTDITSHLGRGSNQHPEARMVKTMRAIGGDLPDDVIEYEHQRRFGTEKAAAAGGTQQQPQAPADPPQPTS